MTLWYFFPLAAGLSLILTGRIRNYALARNLLDVPNNRSSHQVPTPRLGGLAIAATFLTGLFFLWAADALPTGDALALSGAGAWVAWVGFLDDRGHIAARWRLLAHFLGAAWILFWLGSLPPLPVFGSQVALGWPGSLLAALYLVWLLNLYNFMDGIDGIAGVEAITTCLGGAVVYALAVPEGSGWMGPVLLLAAVAGFLPWNWPPARIFMGDAGSGFLGLTLGILSLQAAQTVPDLFWCWLILLGVFVVDATVTLLRRVLRGEKFYQAHRSHAYQHAARLWGSHRPVTCGVGMINLFWLLPLAIMVALGRISGLSGVLIGYLPLVCLVFLGKGGARELSEKPG
jgi:Fuc2NAc and GlcNAc transferase